MNTDDQINEAKQAYIKGYRFGIRYINRMRNKAKRRLLTGLWTQPVYRGRAGRVYINGEIIACFEIKHWERHARLSAENYFEPFEMMNRGLRASQ